MTDRNEFITKQELVDAYQSTDLYKLMQSGQIQKMLDLDESFISSLSDYAKKSDLPDFSQYAKKSELPIEPDLTSYAKKSDLPSLDGFAKKEDVPKQQDLGQYAKREELNNCFRVDEENQVSGHTTFTGFTEINGGLNTANTSVFGHFDAWHESDFHDNVNMFGKFNGHAVSDYALKSDLPKDKDLSNYATKDELNKVANDLRELTTMRSPDGQKWLLSINNDGLISTSKLMNKE